MNWYDEYPHLGYDLDGKPIKKPIRGDEIDNFLRKMENPESWSVLRWNSSPLSPFVLFKYVDFKNDSIRS